MNISNLENSISSTIIFYDHINNSSSYKKAMISYYDMIMNMKLAFNKEVYMDAKYVIINDWDKISEFVLFISKKCLISIKSTLELLKSPYVVKIFHYFDWSLKNIHKSIINGIKAWKNFIKIIFEYKKKYGVNEWHNRCHHEFMNFFKSKKYQKSFTDEKVSEMLLCVWLNTSFLKNINNIVDISDIIISFRGQYNIDNLLLSNDIIKFAFEVLSLVNFDINCKSINQVVEYIVYVMSVRYDIILYKSSLSEIKIETSFLENKHGNC